MNSAHVFECIFTFSNGQPAANIELVTDGKTADESPTITNNDGIIYLFSENETISITISDYLTIEDYSGTFSSIGAGKLTTINTTLNLDESEIIRMDNSCTKILYGDISTMKIDFCTVGGGGGGSYYENGGVGGGGGYAASVFDITPTSNKIIFSIGAGGAAGQYANNRSHEYGGDGGTTTVKFENGSILSSSAGGNGGRLRASGAVEGSGIGNGNGGSGNATIYLFNDTSLGLAGGGGGGNNSGWSAPAGGLPYGGRGSYFNGDTGAGPGSGTGPGGGGGGSCSNRWPTHGGAGHKGCVYIRIK